MKKIAFWALPLALTMLAACHIPTHLQGGGEGVAIIDEEDAKACVYIGEVSGFSFDEFKNSSEEEMRNSAMNSLRNSASVREANAVVIKKQQAYRKAESATWRYNVSGTAYLCQ